MGIGIKLEGTDGGYFWGLVSPHMLIRSMVAMKILELAETINPHQTLAAAYDASSDKISTHTRNILFQSGVEVDELESTIERLRQEVLSSTELITAMSKLADMKITIDDFSN